MKRKTLFVLAAFGLALSVAALPAAAQTVDDIIAKSLEARGGKAKIQAVKSAVFTGKMGMGPAGEAPAEQHVSVEHTACGVGDRVGARHLRVRLEEHGVERGDRAA